MISKEEIQNLAELARLKLTDMEIDGLQKDVSNILNYVEAVSTAKIPSDLARDDAVNTLHNVMRDDMPRLTNDALAGKEEALRAAFPRREGNFNVVRKIIQKDE